MACCDSLTCHSAFILLIIHIPFSVSGCAGFMIHLIHSPFVHLPVRSWYFQHSSKATPPKRARQERNSYPQSWWHSPEAVHRKLHQHRGTGGCFLNHWINTPPVLCLSVVASPMGSQIQALKSLRRGLQWVLQSNNAGNPPIDVTGLFAYAKISSKKLRS